MMHQIVAALAGLLFGIGLIVSGMTNPAKVQSFLDLAGRWDPSLALVMGGAIAVGLPAFSLARRRSHSLLGDPMQLPANRRIDRRLLAGTCCSAPAGAWQVTVPARAKFASRRQLGSLAFVCAMLSGMGLFEFAERRKA
jgi:hypothetical protein